MQDLEFFMDRVWAIIDPRGSQEAERVFADIVRFAEEGPTEEVREALEDGLPKTRRTPAHLADRLVYERLAAAHECLMPGGDRRRLCSRTLELLKAAFWLHALAVASFDEDQEAAPPQDGPSIGCGYE